MLSGIMALNYWRLSDTSCVSLQRGGPAIGKNGFRSLPVFAVDFRDSDACEWKNFRSLFEPDAYVYTTWSGKVHIDDFIHSSQAGMDKGAFIMHRVHGSTTDINASATRAVTKMKGTITQRFDLSGCEVDAESDCRFIFLFRKDPSTNSAREWKAKFVRHWYEKDKLIPVDHRKVPVLDDRTLMQFPPGYRYLAYCQQVTMNVEVRLDLPGHNREKGTINGEKHDLLYWQAKQWLEGGEVAW